MDHFAGLDIGFAPLSAFGRVLTRRRLADHEPQAHGSSEIRRAKGHAKTPAAPRFARGLHLVLNRLARVGSRSKLAHNLSGHPRTIH